MLYVGDKSRLAEKLVGLRRSKVISNCDKRVVLMEKGKEKLTRVRKVVWTHPPRMDFWNSRPASKWLSTRLQPHFRLWRRSAQYLWRVLRNLCGRLAVSQHSCKLKYCVGHLASSRFHASFKILSKLNLLISLQLDFINFYQLETF